jgi:hypothetical protein
MTHKVTLVVAAELAAPRQAGLVSALTWYNKSCCVITQSN